MPLPDSIKECEGFSSASKYHFLTDSHTKRLAFYFSFEPETSLFEAANKINAYLTKNKLIKTRPFIDTLETLKFHQNIDNDSTELTWYVKGHQICLVTKKVNVVFYSYFKTSETPKLKDIFPDTFILLYGRKKQD